MSMERIYPVLQMGKARQYEDSILCSDPARTQAAMENAGRAIGQAIHQDYLEFGEWPERPRIIVLCGKGLNTGDALVACELLNGLLPGLSVQLVLTAPEEALDPLAGAALNRLKDLMGEKLALQPVSCFLANPDTACEILIDALYGLGFKPPLREEPAALLRIANKAGNISMRASIDLPSGIGDSREPDAFIADFTYIPGVPKAPVVEMGNADHTGRIRFLEIEPFRHAEKAGGSGPLLVSPRYFRKLRGLRSAASDKRTFGHCLILGGSREMPGALMMSVLGSLHAGAGLVTAAFPASMAERVAGTIPEAMWRPLPVKPGGGIEVESVRIISQLVARADALLVGPGMVMDRATTFAVCRIVRECQLPVVIDASALTQDVLAAVVGRPLSAGPVILTPHQGEFNRISGIPLSDISDDALCQFSSKYRLLTILKGSPNRISDGNNTYILPAGGPVLARGGSGDILSGMLVTLLGQMPDQPLEAALNAVSWHGAAADLLARAKGTIAVRTTEILPFLGKTLR